MARRICPYFIICQNPWCNFSKPVRTPYRTLLCKGRNDPDARYMAMVITSDGYPTALNAKAEVESLSKDKDYIELLELNDEDKTSSEEDKGSGRRNYTRPRQDDL